MEIGLELIIIHESIIKKENTENIGSIISLLKKRSPLAIFSESNSDIEPYLEDLNISEHFHIIFSFKNFKPLLQMINLVS